MKKMYKMKFQYMYQRIHMQKKKNNCRKISKINLFVVQVKTEIL